MKKSSTWIDAYGSYTMQTDRTDCFFFKFTVQTKKAIRQMSSYRDCSKCDFEF